MALTKVGSGGIENVTNSANATFLTIDASEQITVASEGGAVTTSIQQGLAKAWAGGISDSAVEDDSLNISSITDLGSGENQPFWTNSFNNTGYAISATNQHDTAFYNRLVGQHSKATGSVKFKSYVAESGLGSSVDQQFIANGDLA